MKYIVVFILIVMLVLLCYPYQEGFGATQTVDNPSYILLLRQPNLDMILTFNDVSKGYLAFDVSNSANLNKFINAYREVTFDIGVTKLIDTYNRAASIPSSYLIVNSTKDKDKTVITITSSTTAPTQSFTPSAYTGQTEIPPSTKMVHANGIMLKKDAGANAKWTIFATEVSPSEICKIGTCST